MAMLLRKVGDHRLIDDHRNLRTALSDRRDRTTARWLCSQTACSPRLCSITSRGMSFPWPATWMSPSYSVFEHRLAELWEPNTGVA